MKQPAILALGALTLVAQAAPAQAPLTEPHSGVSFPASLTPPGGTAAHWITGTAIREVTIFIVTVQVYAFGLYVEREAARASLARYAGRPAASLAQDASFYERLLRLDFAMTLRLVMTRDVGGRGCRQGVRRRAAAAHGAPGKRLRRSRARGVAAVPRLLRRGPASAPAPSSCSRAARRDG